MVDTEGIYKQHDIPLRVDLQKTGVSLESGRPQNVNRVKTGGRLSKEASRGDALCPNSSGVAGVESIKMTTTGPGESEWARRGSREFLVNGANGSVAAPVGDDGDDLDDLSDSGGYRGPGPRSRWGGSSQTTVPDGRVGSPGLDRADEPLLDLSASATDVDHCHAAAGSGPDTSANRRAQKQLIFAASVCFLFMVGEIIGGWLSHSLAIMTDAAHLLSDFTSFLISLFALWLARRPPTAKMSFGYLRAEILGAVISVLIIWVATGVLVYLAIQRCITTDYDIDAKVMLITAGCGLGVNILLAVVLHLTGHSHSHGGIGSGHGHSHGGTNPDSDSQYKPAVDASALSIQSEPLLAAEVGGGDAEVGLAGGQGQVKPGRSEANMNVRAAFIHILGDLLQSVGVCIAAIIILVKPDWKLADPICTFTFSVLVLITTVLILRDAIQVLMEGVPKHINLHHLRSDLKCLPHVRMAHGLHVWSLTTSQAAMAVHLCIDAGEDAENVLQQASQLVRSKYNIIFSTIQVEHYQPEVMNNCDRCLESSN